MKIILSAVMACALVLPATTVLAQARHAPVTEFSAARKTNAQQRHACVVPQRKIACTFYGCHPVPIGCTPVTGRDFFGNPTDYDDVVCR
jgi:hypothetical protein